MVAAGLSAGTTGLFTVGKVVRRARLTEADEADEADAPVMPSNQTSRMSYCPMVDG